MSGWYGYCLKDGFGGEHENKYYSLVNGCSLRPIKI